MSFAPTPEQVAIIEAYRTGENLVIQAGAGTGKTSTLRLIAEADPTRRGTYIAFNRAIASEAKGSFPSNVTAGTAHSLAFRAVGKRYKARLDAPRQFARETARHLRVSPLTVTAFDGQPKMFSDVKVAKIVMDAVASFCRSADTEITAWHFRVIAGLDPADERGPRRGPVMERVAATLLPFAQAAWADLTRLDGNLRFEHDHYLKMYQLSSPRIPGDFLLFDEAQDANPVIAAIVEAQTHLQVILVGDSSQAIYGFTGAVDAMAKFAARGTAVRTLSQSFRFGPAVAAVANDFLDRLGAPLRLVGFDKIDSRVAALDTENGPTADAVLCRTNAGCLGELIAALNSGRKAAIVGGTGESVRFVEAARDLADGKGTDHPELVGFTSWTQVESYVEDEDDAADLKTWVKIVADFGVDALLVALRAGGDEKHAEVVISTAHKAKGREWDTVRIADFVLNPEKGATDADLMLAYVAVTRAKITLDTGTLTDFLADEDEAPQAPQAPHAVTHTEHAVIRRTVEGDESVFGTYSSMAAVRAALAVMPNMGNGNTYRAATRTVTVTLTPWQVVSD